MAFLKSVLLREGLRSDRIWVSPIFFREPFRRIPFYLDRLALSRSQYWPRTELRKLGVERFSNIVKHASHIPFWKKRFIEAGIDPNHFREGDIAKIPLLSKKDFLDKVVEEYTVPTLLQKSQEYHTSGSTGRPFSFYHDDSFELRSSSVSERMFRAAGDGVRFPVILMKGFPHLGFDYAEHSFFFLRGYNGVQYRVQALQELVHSLKSEVILFGIASSLLELARVCREHNISLPLRRVLATGEALSISQKREIEDSLRVEVRVSYGASELRRLGFECNHHRIHINEESAYFEITDDYGTPLPLGVQGRLVVSGFENIVMPFIRYDTGDYAILHENLCPCGRTLRTIEFQGRQVKVLDVGGGRMVSLVNIAAIFDTYPNVIRQFQIVRTATCSFLMRIVPGPRFEGEKTKGILTECFKSIIHPRVNISWEEVGTIQESPSGKAIYFVDRI